MGKRTKNPNTKDGGLFAAYLNDPANWQHVGAVTFTLGATATRFPFATLARTIEELAAETMHRIETGRLMPYEG